MNPYMYLFVREDLSHAQQIVQTAHAVDELNKTYPHTSGNYMVLCGLQSEDDLLKLSSWLEFNSVLHEKFYEPDISSFTAIATRPLIGEERKLMKKFKTKK